MKFWSKQASSASLGKSNPPVLQIPVANDKSLINKESVKEDDSLPSSAIGKLGGVVSKQPAQLQLKKQFEVLTSDLLDLCERERQGLLTEKQHKTMQQLKKRKRELETKLKKKKGDQVRSQKARENKKKRLNADLKENPELCEILKTRISSGRPPLEEEQPLLPKTIIDIAMHGSASHDKRHNDMYQCVKTLDQLKSDGFVISRSGFYLRLQP